MTFKWTRRPDTANTDYYPTGASAEKMAESWLGRQGLVLLQRNFHCKQGEIDLIMQDRDILVFVEVRFRKSSAYGFAAETVTASKQRKLILAAQNYLLHNKPARHKPMRFDVIGIMPKNPDGYDYNWLQNAFMGIVD